MCRTRGHGEKEPVPVPSSHAAEVHQPVQESARCGPARRSHSRSRGEERRNDGGASPSRRAGDAVCLFRQQPRLRSVPRGARRRQSPLVRPIARPGVVRTKRVLPPPVFDLCGRRGDEQRVESAVESVRGRECAEQRERGEQREVERSAAGAAGGRREEAGGAVRGVFGDEAIDG